jgi:hypothetical protein
MNKVDRHSTPASDPKVLLGLEQMLYLMAPKHCDFNNLMLRILVTPCVLKD